MHILHVLTRFLRAGSEENTIHTALHQAKAGHCVTIVHGNEYDQRSYPMLDGQVRAHCIDSMVHPLNPKRDIQAVFALKRFIRENGVDLVHTHQSKAGVLGRIAAKMAGVPFIVHGVHIIPFENVGRIQRLIYLAAEHVTGSFTDLFVHVSEGTRTAYWRERIAAGVPHAVVRSGMDVAKFRDGQPPEDWRTILGMDATEEKPRVMLMLAALEPRKRHVEFLDGFAKATTTGQPIRLLLAGDGPQREAAKSRISALGLDAQVKLLGHYPEPQRLVALADVGVLASVREGLPRVVIQYLAGGVPAVVSPIAGIEEIVEDAVNGRIVRSADAESVAVEAVRVLTNRDECERLAAGARKAPVDNWSFESMFSALDASYALLPGYTVRLDAPPQVIKPAAPVRPT